jgi:two-component system, LytTR family, response regulator
MHDYLFFRTGKCFCKIKFSDILYIRAEKKLVHVVTTSQTHIVLNSFKEVEKCLPQSIFYKVHRSYIISLDHADKFDGEFVYMGNKKVPISDRYRFLLKNTVGILTCYVESLRLNGDDIDNLLRNLNQ